MEHPAFMLLAPEHQRAQCSADEQLVSAPPKSPRSGSCDLEEEDMALPRGQSLSQMPGFPMMPPMGIWPPEQWLSPWRFWNPWGFPQTAATEAQSITGTSVLRSSITPGRAPNLDVESDQEGTPKTAQQGLPGKRTLPLLHSYQPPLPLCLMRWLRLPPLLPH